MHTDVLRLLEAHLDEMQRLRHALVSARSVHPGERWRAAAATVRSAEHYARTAGRVLAGDVPDPRLDAGFDAGFGAGAERLVQAPADPPRTC